MPFGQEVQTIAKKVGMNDVMLQDKRPVVFIRSICLHYAIDRLEMYAIDAVFQCHEHHRGVAILHPQMRDIEPLGGQRLPHLVSVLVLADNRHGGYRNAHSCKMDTPVNAVASRIEYADVLIDVRAAKTSRTRFNTHTLLQCSKGDPPHGEPPFRVSFIVLHRLSKAS